MSDLEELAHMVAQNIDVLLTHDGREAVNKASEFSRSMGKLMEPLSLPENRTEADWHLLGQALLAGTHTESRRIGTQTDENGVEHEVWQHTFTPCHWESPPLDPEARRHKAEMRARKLKRRQRRAVQRRYNRGMR